MFSILSEFSSFECGLHTCVFYIVFDLGKNSLQFCLHIRVHSQLLFITGRNEVLAKAIFLHLSVILFTGGVSGKENPPGHGEPPRHGEPPWHGDPPGIENPPQHGEPPQHGDPPGHGEPPGMETPLDQAPSPQHGDPPDQTPPSMENPPCMEIPPTRPPPPGSRLRHTVYDRPVRILLECILVKCELLREIFAK